MSDLLAGRKGQNETNLYWTSESDPILVNDKIPLVSGIIIKSCCPLFFLAFAASLPKKCFPSLFFSSLVCLRFRHFICLTQDQKKKNKEKKKVKVISGRRSWIKLETKPGLTGWCTLLVRKLLRSRETDRKLNNSLFFNENCLFLFWGNFEMTKHISDRFESNLMDLEN